VSAVDSSPAPRPGPATDVYEWVSKAGRRYVAVERADRLWPVSMRVVPSISPDPHATLSR
jgi:hypothetical protein